jgi:hypothetical protein
VLLPSALPLLEPPSIGGAASLYWISVLLPSAVPLLESPSFGGAASLYWISTSLSSIASTVPAALSLLGVSPLKCGLLSPGTQVSSMGSLVCASHRPSHCVP